MILSMVAVRAFSDKLCLMGTKATVIFVFHLGMSAVVSTGPMVESQLSFKHGNCQVAKNWRS